jgi:prepilin-type N-terminal cleavage/methylation domain-containing protein
MPKQQGFSMMELMIVIAIIGILSSIAIPNYKQYTMRANMAEIFTLIQPVKLAMSEALINNMPLHDINNQSLGIDPNTPLGKIRSLSVEAGIMRIQGDPEKLGLAEDIDASITMTPRTIGDLILWECAASEALRALLPASCRP